MCPYFFFCVLMDSNGSLCELIGPYSSLRILTGPYCFFLGPYSSLWLLMGLYGSLEVLVRPYGPLWVLLVPFASLWILMGFYGSLLVLNRRFHSVLMGLHKSLFVLMDTNGILLACLHVHFWEPVLSSSA